MTGKQKIKGNKFERDAAKDLSVSGGSWKRVPGSGALGVNLSMSDLMGDVHGHYAWFKKSIKGENKTGYGSSKSIRIQREWLVKNREQARLDDKYPALLLKFIDVTGGDIGSAKLICFNFDVWNQLMKDVNDIYEQYLKLLEKDYNEKTSIDK